MKDPVRKTQLKICYFGTYRANYMRNQILIRGLREAGHKVIECHQPLWQDDEDRSQVAGGGWVKPKFWLRVVRAYLRLIQLYRKVGDYDVMLVGYLGQFDLFLARILSWMRGKPLVWDVLMSLYLIASERRFTSPWRAPLFLYRIIEWIDCRLPDHLVSDTPQYIEWMCHTYGIPAERFWLVPIGAEDYLFSQSGEYITGPAFRVVYYGTFIPNHNVFFMLEAARLLAAETDIQFEFIGDGPEKQAVMGMARSYSLNNVKFFDWMQRSDLINYVAGADLLLGSFGKTINATSTLHNKIYEALALGKPVIVGDSPTVRHFLKHGEHVYICGRDDPAELAAAILDLKNNLSLRQYLASTGRRYFEEHFTTKKIGAMLGGHLVELVNQ